MSKLGTLGQRYANLTKALQLPELRSAITAGNEAEVQRLVAEQLGVQKDEVPSEAIRTALAASIRKLQADDDAGPDYPKDARRMSRFLSSLSGALGREETKESPAVRRGRWFSGPPENISLPSVLDYLSGVLTTDAARGPNDEGLRKQGYEPLLTRLRHDPTLRFALTDKQAKGLAYRVREVNAALFGNATFALADRLRALQNRPLADLPRVGTEPKETDQPMFGSTPKDVVSEGLGTEPKSIISGAKQYVAHHGPNGAYFHNRAVIGEFGPELAKAIVEAGRIAMSVVDEVAPSLAGEAHQKVMGRLTNQKEAVPLLQEGIVSIGHVLALLLAKKPEGMTLDEALQKIGEQGLVARVAMYAPFGQIAPMNAQGLVPSDALTVNERGLLLAPKSLHDALKTAADRAFLPSMDHPQSPEHPTQTLMGCPVASKVPQQSGDRRDSPLHALAAEYIELVRRLLREAH